MKRKRKVEKNVREKNVDVMTYKIRYISEKHSPIKFSCVRISSRIPRSKILPRANIANVFIRGLSRNPSSNSHLFIVIVNSYDLSAEIE